MKRIFIGGLIIIILVVGGLLFNKHHAPTADITIGILQTASHPALDAARRGFEEELRKQFEARVHFVTKNAQGSIANAHTIAQLFANDDSIAGVLAIATPAAQAIAHIEHIKPIFITAITDPVGLGLRGPLSNVCGASDMVNSASTAQLATTLVPRAKIAAILFNVGEASSAAMAAQLRVQLLQRGLQVIFIGMVQETDLPAAVNKACSKADIIVTPLDNMVASTITFIAAQAQLAKKPLIVSDNLLVEKGALAAAGVDYTVAGKQAAQCALQVLTHHKKPSDVPLAHQPGFIVINKHVLDQLGLSLPTNLKDHVTLIVGQPQ